MNKEFITYEQALALKELGFDEICLAMWTVGGLQLFSERGYAIPKGGYTNTELERDGIVGVPLYQQAFRWFRDIHELEGVVQQANDYTWYKFSIYQKSNFYTSEGWKVLKSQGLEYKTYEVVESACLDKLIEITKNNENTH